MTNEFTKKIVKAMKTADFLALVNLKNCKEM